MFFIILPTQLFSKEYVPKNYTYILWECPLYFTKYKFNKKKLLLHRESMKYYQKYIGAKYVGFNEDITPYTSNFHMFDSIDDFKLLKIRQPQKIYESPNFILNTSEYTMYRQKTDKFFFSAFYKWSKTLKNIIPDIPSQDKHNRKRLREYKEQKVKVYNIQEKEYIETHFPNNPGNTDNFIFPTNHKDARKALKNFIENKLVNFGPYQDFINKDDEFMFHSLLSPCLNIGLLQPMEIINTVMGYTGIPINSLEGYIRQLFWREYQRYTYIYLYKNGPEFNYFNNTKKLTKNWYNGSTGILPVDDAIVKGFESGYLHHIYRLMVIGNFMNLYGIDPKEGFKWFMEFSCDSYIWVMCQNVYGMAFYADGGKTMRRQYISSSNYILKMSNYPRGEWCDIWDSLYKKRVGNKSYFKRT